jgi:hypothetical protein
LSRDPTVSVFGTAFNVDLYLLCGITTGNSKRSLPGKEYDLRKPMGNTRHHTLSFQLFGIVNIQLFLSNQKSNCPVPRCAGGFNDMISCLIPMYTCRSESDVTIRSRNLIAHQADIQSGGDFECIRSAVSIEC